jgi:hypothetical protein
MSASARKLAANRANAKKSSGPRSEPGREKVSQNAIQHGLTGRFQVLEGESQECFDNLFTQLIQDEQPVGAAEVELVRKMAEYTWLRERASRFLEACFLVVERTPEQRANDQAEIRVRPELERYLRYQTHHDRAYARASAELMKRRKERQLVERGFVSQKRAAAAEERRDASEKRQIEKHSVHIATATTKLERLSATASPNETEPRAQASVDFQPLPPQETKTAA